MSVTYEAVRDMSEDSVHFLSGLLDAERLRRGTRKDTRAPSPTSKRCWCCGGSSTMPECLGLASDNAIASSTAYDYRDEGVAVLALRKPSLHGALLAAKATGHSQVIVDGTLIYTDQIDVPGSTPGWICGGAGNVSTMAGMFSSSRPGRVVAVNLGRAPGS